MGHGHDDAEGVGDFIEVVVAELLAADHRDALPDDRIIDRLAVRL